MTDDEGNCYPDYQPGDMEGFLPGSGRRWEIEELEEIEVGFDVWFDGCEHAGTFATYEAAIAAVAPTERGN